MRVTPFFLILSDGSPAVYPRRVASPGSGFAFDMRALVVFDYLSISGRQRKLIDHFSHLWMCLPSHLLATPALEW